MNIAKYEKSGKNCLVVFRNKRVNDFEGATAVIEGFGERGYYFDRVEYVDYLSSCEITFALQDAVKRYENVVLFCPQTMENTLKNFVSGICGGQFDELNRMQTEENNISFLFCDAQNRLKIADIVANLASKCGYAFGRTVIRCVGAPSDRINSAVSKAKTACADLIINVKEKFSDCTIELIYPDNIPKTPFDRAVREIVTALNEHVYALEDVALAERLIQLLKLRRMKICVAESFTGGGVGKRLVEVSGASEVFIEGLNTYANSSKTGRLGVSEQTLNSYGAVSEQTAAQMAQGLLFAGNCDVCIATTGIAGPKSDNTKKPVGLVYLAVGTGEGISVYEYNLKGSRRSITETAINLALFLTYKTLK